MMERLKTMAILALLAALAGSIALAATGGEAEVRITARQLEDGRVEFALQQRVDGEWGERVLPRSRYFPADATVNRWLNSTPLTVSVPVVTNADNLDGDPESTETVTPSASSYTPQVVAISGNDDNSLQWYTGESTDGLQTLLLINDRNAYSPYSVSRIGIVCDHDAPAGNRLRAVFSFSTTWNSNARMGLDDDVTPRYTLGSTYAANQLQGTGVTASDDRVHFALPSSFIADAKRLRWMTVGAESILDGWVSHGFDLSVAWNTPVQRNLENCG